MNLDDLKVWLENNIFAKNGNINGKKIEKNFRWIKSINTNAYLSIMKLRDKYNVEGAELMYKILVSDSTGVCIQCGKATKFYRFCTGYPKFCSSTCMSRNENIKTKIKKSKFIRYGSETYTNRVQAATTCMLRYGKANPSQLDSIKDKKKNTYKSKYSCESAFQVDKDSVWEQIRKTNKSRYGVEYMLQSKDIIEKGRDTMLREYGTRLYQQSEKYKARIPEIVKKRFDTMKARKNTKGSKTEKIIFNMLMSRFIDIVRHYKSKTYPWVCDFYVPSQDLYIEYQGHWTHGGFEFDTTPICLEQLKIWEFKSKSSNFYKKAIEVWTQRDVEKRMFVKQNNINWLEFFNKQEVEEYINGQ